MLTEEVLWGHSISDKVRQTFKLIKGHDQTSISSPSLVWPHQCISYSGQALMMNGSVSNSSQNNDVIKVKVHLVAVKACFYGSVHFPFPFSTFSTGSKFTISSLQRWHLIFIFTKQVMTLCNMNYCLCRDSQNISANHLQVHRLPKIYFF